MPRTARIDIPGLLQHVIVRGIEKRDIFFDNQDKAAFLKRLTLLIRESETDCFAWAFLDNHVHLLLRPRTSTLAYFMRRLLTGYAVVFNLRHKRAGYVFQNRFKSIVCDQDAYLLSLIRYIHLNPLRAGLVHTLEELETYPWCGHAALLKGEWFNPEVRDEIMALFSASRHTALKNYREYIAVSTNALDTADLSGGGKRRSLALDPTLAEDAAFDDRILSAGDFVTNLVGRATESAQDESRIALPELIQRICRHYGVESTVLREFNRDRQLAKIKGVICYLALRRFGYQGREIAAELGLTPSGVSVAARRGGKFFENNRDALRETLAKLRSIS
ncbi:REP element-mobilizing transposase RayT [Geoalkalibacter ferrihydriticus]|uniref:REP element-mobilizing transposase RayT n=2 Tax=Geoalkalibacter ferrihydriticus TaxID=392333 RepID=A0A1G9V6P5_9BACT|nr:REP element-mobilizing transposase RayT [Geoalkalibacter ferrihydriticus]